MFFHSSTFYIYVPSSSTRIEGTSNHKKPFYLFPFIWFPFVVFFLLLNSFSVHPPLIILFVQFWIIETRYNQSNQKTFKDIHFYFFRLTSIKCWENVNQKSVLSSDFEWKNEPFFLIKLPPPSHHQHQQKVNVLIYSINQLESRASDSTSTSSNHDIGGPQGREKYKVNLFVAPPISHGF